MFTRMMDKQAVLEEEGGPYRQALDSDEALRAVDHWWRAIPLWASDRFDPVPMPTTFIWPPGSDHISRALRAGQETLTRLLVAHLAEHASTSP